MMSVEYTIRRACPSDANGIAAAHRDSIRSVGPQFYPPSVVEDWGAGLTPDIYVNAMEGGEVFFVAIGQIDNNPAVLGFATHRIDDVSDGGSVYVRGIVTRRGIGSALLRIVEAHAIGKGATSIPVEASLAGVKFFKANGFEEVGRGDTLLMSGDLSPACSCERRSRAHDRRLTSKWSRHAKRPVRSCRCGARLIWKR
jgi:putative acetyltransferase